MDFSFSPEDESFRTELRAWLDAELPQFLSDWAPVPGPEDADPTAAFARTQDRRRDWQRRLDAGRWAAVNWPRAWRGRAATPVQNVI